jgi:glucose 1-dehydrogenase
MIEKFLEQQVPLVTGGGSGIGAACAVELARRGAFVGVNYLSQREQAEAVVQDCRAHGVEAHSLQGDVSDPSSVEKLFNAFDEKFDRIDILVANAGIQRDAPFTEMSCDEWQQVIDVNLTGQFLCAQQATSRFLNQKRRGEGRSIGKIVHMSSVHEVIPWAGHVNYAASKAAVQMLAKSLAQELAAQGIRVNTVSPGAIRTPLNESVWSDAEKAEALAQLIPDGRIGEPGEVAAVVAWLVSDYAGYVTGETLYVDGGMTLYPAFRDNG